MSRCILSVSYDEQLLTTRQWLLEKASYHVTSVLSMGEALARCAESRFDLLIIGHSIPPADKLKVIDAFRRNNPVPVLSLRRQGDQVLSAAEYHVLSENPDALLQMVENIFAKTRDGPQMEPPSKSPAKSYTILSAASKSKKEKDDLNR